MRRWTPSTPLLWFGRFNIFIFYFVTWISLILQFRRSCVRIGRDLLDRRWRAIFELAWGKSIGVVFHGLVLSKCPGLWRRTAGRVFLCFYFPAGRFRLDPPAPVRPRAMNRSMELTVILRDQPSLKLSS